ncbi:DUF6933 domain-containing protein [Marinobacterium iners]|uniref:DUF6933 domain-containing protein n=1 Tax=Marinobacterium iners DSM 11526 TaxID=1122198 RepID=A0A1H4AXP7_9GAMM|nr:hypothetical protein [Marinobacterium iners]SEA40693.1 hypothetical protein SAMN02745729_10397 [Marinobacterium iners DSM 11526]
MRIHVTNKLAEKLKKAGFEIADSAEEQPSALGDWHANITTIQRRQCLVFTHDQTRYSLALIGMTQKEIKELTYWFSDMLANTMLKQGYPVELMERAVSSFSELSFDTQCSRSVQGTLRNMIWDLESFTWGGTEITDLAPYSISASLCERPCSIKGMRELDCLWPTEEMQKLLEQLPGPHETLH